MRSNNDSLSISSELLVGRFIACCTNNGILHLFEVKEEFAAFTLANASSIGLVMAWIDGVEIHRSA